MSRTRPVFWLFFGLICCAYATGCDSDSEPAARAEDSHVVATTFYPTTWFAHRIIGEHATVFCPLPAGADPARWSPDDETVRRYQQADLILLNGANLEKWTRVVSLPASRVIDTTAGLDVDFLYYDTTTHQHGPGGARSRDDINVHTWLDPLINRQQAARITDAAVRVWPEQAEAFQENLAALQADLSGLDEELRRLTPRLQQVTLVGSRPTWDYLARRHDWNIRPIAMDPTREIDVEARQTLAALAAEQAVVVLWESAPSAETVRWLESQEIRSVVFASGSTPPDVGDDYLTLMGGNIERLAAALP